MGDRVCGPVERTISEFATAELVDELASREGVAASYADAGARVSVDAEGPATVIVVRHGRSLDELTGRPRLPREVA